MQTRMFFPEDCKNREQAVILTVDEYETIRLIDKEELSQEQCGERMQVARTTVQQIYASARKKQADVLVDGLSLRIEGGDYRLCNGGSRSQRPAGEHSDLRCIGGGAQAALAQTGIKLYGGVSGSADEAVGSLLAETLKFDPTVRCGHHDHQHGDEPHTCGDHGCGHHSCG